MKLKAYILLFAITAIIACKNNSKNGELPKPGTVLAKEEMPVLNDTLNKFTFAVSLIADSLVEQGIYDVNAVWGYNDAKTKFTMPKGAENLKPILRKSSKPYTFVIGFKTDKDTTFYDYYEINGDHGTIKMQYIKSYSFQ